MASTKKSIPNPFNVEVDGDVRIAIIRAQWNEHITAELAKGCVETLEKHGVNSDFIDEYTVPGAIELTFASAQAIISDAYDAVIAFGCVIRGETPHFDYVCQSVTQGITYLNSEYEVPTIFGVLTVNDEQQALDRIGGRCGHKGVEAAEAALSMVRLKRDFQDLIE